MSTPKKCVGVVVFGSKGTGALASSITAVTRPSGYAAKDVPTHAGVILFYDDDSYDYAEAFIGQDWATNLPAEKLISYSLGRGQWVRCFCVPLTPEQCQDLRILADRYRLLWHYSVPQLLRMLRSRLTFGLWPVKSTPRQVVCSEAVARLLRHLWPAVVKNSGRSSVEDVAPVDLFVAARNSGLVLQDLATLLNSWGEA